MSNPFKPIKPRENGKFVSANGERKPEDDQQPDAVIDLDALRKKAVAAILKMDFSGMSAPAVMRFIQGMDKDQEASQSTADQEQDARHAMTEALTDDERERLGMLYDLCDSIMDGARKRVGQPLPAWRPTKLTSSHDYLFLLLRTQQVGHLLDTFLGDHGLREKFDQQVVPKMEGICAHHIGQFLENQRQEVREAFVIFAEQHPEQFQLGDQAT